MPSKSFLTKHESGALLTTSEVFLNTDSHHALSVFFIDPSTAVHWLARLLTPGFRYDSFDRHQLPRMEESTVGNFFIFTDTATFVACVGHDCRGRFLGPSVRIPLFSV